MPSSHESDLPNVGEILGRVLQRVPMSEQPLLIAAAERLAATRYRGWASAASDPTQRSQLMACADREEEIAQRIEALFPNAAATQREILANNPGVEDINRSLFADRPLHQQFKIQAQGERLGAATWRAFAQHAQSPLAAQTFQACAELEEASALVLEAILGEQIPPL
jgi:hypothetical protein